jgi:arylsulfatase A-like enzyme
MSVQRMHMQRILLLLVVCIIPMLGCGDSAPAKTKAPLTGPKVIRLARATEMATHLSVSPREALEPRTVFTTKTCPPWAGAKTSVNASAIEIEAGEAFSITTTTATTPRVDYVLKAVVKGTDLQLAALLDGGPEEAVIAESPTEPGTFELTARILADSASMKIQLSGKGNATIRRIELREAVRREPVQLLSSADVSIRGFLRVDMRGGDEYWSRETLFATGQSDYEWAWPWPNSGAILEFETAIAPRHGDESAAPVDLIVEVKRSGAWKEEHRERRGSEGDAGLWKRARVAISEGAEAIRLATRATGGERSITVGWGRPTLRLPTPRTAGNAGNMPDVVIITIDALRADKLGAYGSKEGLTPALDRIAKESSVVFEEARAPRGQTWESLTGVAFAASPETVGVVARGDHVARGSVGVADVFADAGYFTARIGNVLLPAGQLGAMDLEEDAKSDVVSAERIAKIFEEEKERPIFLWLHLAATHYPWNLAPDFLPAGMPLRISKAELDQVVVNGGDPKEKRDEFITRADAALKEDDAHVAKIMTMLDRPDRASGPALVAIAADHGSHRGENGIWFMHSTVHRVVLRVPFFLHWAGHLTTRRVPQLVRLIDLGPTLHELAGVAVDRSDNRTARFMGISLAPLVRGETNAAFPSLINIVKTSQGVAVVETDQYKVVAADNASWSYASSGLSVKIPDLSLFAWRNDTAEAKDLSGELPLIAGELLELLKGSRGTIHRSISPEAARLLRQAGYAPSE